MPSRVLEWFVHWFCSRAGVYQTLMLTALWVIYERLHPHMDPNGFWLLYVLTIYSGITQPMLAYVASKSARQTDEILDRLQRMVSDECIVDGRTYDLVADMAKRLVDDDAPPAVTEKQERNGRHA